MVTRGARFWPLLTLVAACSVTSGLDDLTQNAPERDASAGTGGSAGSCEVGVVCNGCATCTDFCACTSPAALFNKCVADCSDAGTEGGAGTSGAAGAAGDAGDAGPNACVNDWFKQDCGVVDFGSTACNDCAVTHCCAELNACFADETCAQLAHCANTQCPPGSDPNCPSQKCPTCSDGLNQAVAAFSCIGQSCSNECL